MVHPFIEHKLKDLSAIFRDHSVKKAYLFGSACTDTFSDTSDVDILIEPGDETDPVIKGENLWALYYALKKILGREVDMVTRENLTNKYFISEVDRTSIPIYG